MIMGIFKSLFSSAPAEISQSAEQVSAEKKRIAFETLRDNGVRAIKIGEYRLAADYLVKATELFPDNEEAESLLAEAYLRGGDMEKALMKLRTIAQKRPDNLQVWISVAQAALHQKEWELVLKACEEAKRLDDESSSVYYYEGLAYKEMEAYDTAVEKFGKAIEKAGEYAAAYFMRAMAYMQDGKLEYAEKDLDFLINKGLADDMVYEQKGFLRKENKDYEGALHAYDKALEINPFNAEAYMGKADVYETKGDSVMALDVYKEALDNMPESLEMWRSLAGFKQRSGDEAGASECTRKLEKLAADSRLNQKEIKFDQIQNRVEDDARKSNPFGL